MLQSEILKIMVGGKGCAFITDTTAHTVNFAAAIVREDTQVAALEIDGTDVLTDSAYADSLNTISGQILFTGDILIAPAGTNFTKIQLTSGSVELLNV
jgi:hypothetical protein